MVSSSVSPEDASPARRREKRRTLCGVAASPRPGATAAASLVRFFCRYARRSHCLYRGFLSCSASFVFLCCTIWYLQCMKKPLFLCGWVTGIVFLFHWWEKIVLLHACMCCLFRPWNYVRLVKSIVLDGKSLIGSIVTKCEFVEGVWRGSWELRSGWNDVKLDQKNIYMI
jgi:hypothetical protein